jgi:hypothetical protein
MRESWMLAAGVLLFLLLLLYGTPYWIVWMLYGAP